MAIWPFNRKKQPQDTTVPEEVQEYYDSGRKQQKGMAWLLALGTLVVTVLLALLLFFGGRWIYQTVTKDDEAQQPTTEQTDNQNKDQANEGLDSSSVNNESDTNQQGSSSTNTDQPAATTPATNTSTTPATGDSSAEIPDTGPGPGGLQ